MSTITVRLARFLSDEVLKNRGTGETATQRLREEQKDDFVKPSFDIFLSHSSLDANIIYGLKYMLYLFGYSAYVDWVEDSQCDRENVTPATANMLRERMDKCRSLFFVTTKNSNTSKWMPWECGYFDGIKQKVCILPVTEVPQPFFNGQEYLGLYPYLTSDRRETDGKTCLWVNTRSGEPILFETWLNEMT